MNPNSLASAWCSDTWKFLISESLCCCLCDSICILLPPCFWSPGYLPPLENTQHCFLITWPLILPSGSRLGGSTVLLTCIIKSPFSYSYLSVTWYQGCRYTEVGEHSKCLADDANWHLRYVCIFRCPHCSARYGETIHKPKASEISHSWQWNRWLILRP